MKYVYAMILSVLLCPAVSLSAECEDITEYTKCQKDIRALIREHVTNPSSKPTQFMTKLDGILNKFQQKTGNMQCMMELSIYASEKMNAES